MLDVDLSLSVCDVHAFFCFFMCRLSLMQINEGMDYELQAASSLSCVIGPKFGPLAAELSRCDVRPMQRLGCGVFARRCCRGIAEVFRSNQTVGIFVLLYLIDNDIKPQLSPRVRLGFTHIY